MTDSTPATAAAFEALLASADPETPNEIDGIDVHHAYEALGMLTCPWRLRTGICQSGCQTEPACETCEPEGGWAQALREAVNGE